MNYFSKLSHFVHQRFIWLLIGSYILAGIFPALGLGCQVRVLGND